MSNMNMNMNMNMIMPLVQQVGGTIRELDLLSCVQDWHKYSSSIIRIITSSISSISSSSSSSSSMIISSGSSSSIGILYPFTMMTIVVRKAWIVAQGACIDIVSVTHRYYLLAKEGLVVVVTRTMTTTTGGYEGEDGDGDVLGGIMMTMTKAVAISQETSRAVSVCCSDLFAMLVPGGAFSPFPLSLLPSLPLPSFSRGTETGAGAGAGFFLSLALSSSTSSTATTTAAATAAGTAAVAMKELWTEASLFVSQSQSQSSSAIKAIVGPMVAGVKKGMEQENTKMLSSMPPYPQLLLTFQSSKTATETETETTFETETESEVGRIVPEADAVAEPEAEAEAAKELIGGVVLYGEASASSTAAAAAARTVFFGFSLAALSGMLLAVGVALVGSAYALLVTDSLPPAVVDRIIELSPAPVARLVGMLSPRLTRSMTKTKPKLKTGAGAGTEQEVLGVRPSRRGLPRRKLY
jgi:hypothetical protein